MADETPASLPSAAKRRPGRPRKERAEPRSVVKSETPDRPDMRLDDPRAAAAQRAKEILGNFDGTEMSTEDFLAPPPPSGWTYEWKRKTVYNQEDPAYIQALRRTGWAEVPAKRHPEMMPLGYKGADIERKGMVLMERPQEITDRFKERDRQAARAQVRTKEEQLNQAAPGTFERSNKDAPMTRIKKGFEPMEIPGDK